MYSLKLLHKRSDFGDVIFCLGLWSSDAGVIHTDDTWKTALKFFCLFPSQKEKLSMDYAAHVRAGK